MDAEPKVKLAALNPCITCKICSGYLIDATTVSECLHTFCKSCLVKHLEENNTCPECKLVIHQSHPLQYIAFDRTMQDIVYKVVPGLQESEFRRQLEFYRSRGQTCPKSLLMVAGNTLLTEKDMLANEDRKLSEAEFNRRMEQINLCIIPKLPAGPRRLDAVQKKFLRCSGMTTIAHLQKYIAQKLFNNQDLYKQVEVLCNDQPLQSERSLKYVYISKWRFHDPPLALTYQRALPIK